MNDGAERMEQGAGGAGPVVLGYAPPRQEPVRYWLLALGAMMVGAVPGLEWLHAYLYDRFLAHSIRGFLSTDLARDTLIWLSHGAVVVAAILLGLALRRGKFGWCGWLVCVALATWQMAYAVATETKWGRFHLGWTQGLSSRACYGWNGADNAVMAALVLAGALYLIVLSRRVNHRRVGWVLAGGVALWGLTFATWARMFFFVALGGDESEASRLLGTGAITAAVATWTWTAAWGVVTVYAAAQAVRGVLTGV